MFNSLWKDVKAKYQYGGTVTRIIVVNCAIFVAINLVKLVLWMTGQGDSFGDFLTWIIFNKSAYFDLTHPWVVVSHMFSHESFGHLFWNMVMLSIISDAATDMLHQRRILPVYLLSGFVGAFFYWVAANYTSFELAESMLGASAAIMGLLFATAIVAPDYRVYLWLIGPVPLKYLCLGLAFLDLISIADGSNTGGHLAHVGGAAMGMLIGQMLRTGTDLTAFSQRLLVRIEVLYAKLTNPKQPPKRPRPEKVYQSDNRKNASASARPDRRSDSVDQARIDQILDKIKQTGYDSLTPEEKETLFMAGRK